MVDEFSISHINHFWHIFFPIDKFFANDKRIGAIKIFFCFFSNDGSRFIPWSPEQVDSSIEIDINQLSALCPINDVIETIRTQPNEVIGCMV